MPLTDADLAAITGHPQWPALAHLLRNGATVEPPSLAPIAAPESVAQRQTTPCVSGSDDSGQYCEIPLTQGCVALVDAEDYERLSAFKWCVQIHRDGRKYATRSDYSSQTRRTVYMHREVLNATGRLYGDHEDGNGLNNRRFNLREASGTHNNANRHRLPTNTSGYRGVFWWPAEKKWAARLTCKGEKHWGGLHETKEAAARAYDALALLHFGDFARFNFPNAGEASA